MHDKSGTIALVIACVVLAVSLAGLGKVYWNKRALNTASTAPEVAAVPVPTPGEPGLGAATPGAVEAPGAMGLPGGPGQSAQPGGRAARAGGEGRQGAPSAAPTGGGLDNMRGGFPGRQAGTAPPAGTARQFAGSARQGPGASDRVAGGAARSARPGGQSGAPASRPASGGGGAPSGGEGRPAAPSFSGGGQALGPDPQIIAQWDRDLARARETLQNAKVAIRENNQDQLRELLDQALAELPNLSAQPATARTGTGRAGPPPGAPASARLGSTDPADTLALGRRVQELLFSTLDSVRGLSQEEYEAQRNQIVIGILTGLLTSSQTSYGTLGSESGSRLGPGGPRSGAGMPAAGSAGPRSGRGRPAGEAATPPPQE